MILAFFFFVREFTSMILSISDRSILPLESMSYILKAHFNFFSGSPFAIRKKKKTKTPVEGQHVRSLLGQLVPVILIAMRNSLE